MTDQITGSESTVWGEIEGTTYVLGNHRLIEDRGQCSPELETTLKAHEDAGRKRE